MIGGCPDMLELWCSCGYTQ